MIRIVYKGVCKIYLFIHVCLNKDFLIIVMKIRILHSSQGGSGSSVCAVHSVGILFPRNYRSKPIHRFFHLSLLIVAD